MKKNEEIARQQSDKALAIQKLQEESYQARNHELEVQRKVAEQSMADLKFLGYSEYKNKISTQLNQGYYVDSTIISLLEEKLTDAALSERAAQDAQSEAEPWSTRIALLLMLYRTSGTRSFLDKATQLTIQNASSLNSSIAALYGWRPGRNQSFARSPLIVGVAELVINQDLNLEFRDGLLSSVSFFTSPRENLNQLLGETRLRRLVKHISDRARLAAPQSATSCHPIPTYLTVLRDISAEAELVYGVRILEDSTVPPPVRECVKANLSNGQSYSRPSESAFGRWPT